MNKEHYIGFNPAGTYCVPIIFRNDDAGWIKIIQRNQSNTQDVSIRYMSKKDLIKSLRSTLAFVKSGNANEKN